MRKIMRGLIRLLLIIATLACYGTGLCAADFQVYSPPSTRKIQRTGGEIGQIAHAARIAMGLREYEPVQIVIKAGLADLAAVRVSTSALTGPNGHIIPKHRIVVTPIGYVHCKSQTDGAVLSGEIPDVLLPDRPMSVKAGQHQPFFVTVQTLPDDLPGEYRGSILISADDQIRTIPLNVRVYNVTLPLKPHLRTAFVLWGKFDKYMMDRPQAYLDTYLRYAKVMLQYRLSPITMWPPKKKADGSWDFTDIDRYMTEMVPLGVTSFNFGGNGDVTASANVAFAEAAAKHLKEKGWWDLSYIYGIDEASPSIAGTLRENYSKIVNAVPDIKIMQTGWSPKPELQGLVKIWCPLTVYADFSAIREAQKFGDEVWWYVCGLPLGSAANVHVDHAGSDHRMLGWQTYKYGIDGFLYWGVDYWEGNNLPIAQYDKSNYALWLPSVQFLNGDGYLFYPGLNDTPVPTMRIALLRDGLEDYDLFKEVEALATGDTVLARRTRDLLRLDAPLITDLTNFTKRDEDLQKRRESILQAGEMLSVNAM